MNRRTIKTDRAPEAIGPYSQGIVAGEMLFTAMQIALDPTSGDLVGVDAAGQIKQCLTNIQAIVTAAGGQMDAVVKTTVFLADMGEFGNMNAAYAEFFGEAPPARAVIEVADLPKSALVAVEAVAQVPVID